MGFQPLLLALLSSFFLLTSAQANVRKIGNDLIPSASGIDVAGSIFLLNDKILGDGVLFAFSAFFRHDTVVRLQIWRPLSADIDAQGDNLPFELLSELRVIPAVQQAREDVYIESRLTEPCVRVRRGDRLGVYFEEAPGAVAYTFDADSPTALGTTVENAVMVGNKTFFNSLSFPYDFSLAAYFDADIETYNDSLGESQFVPCPRGLLVDDFVPIALNTTTTAPITGRPGDTGPPGPTGEQGEQGPTGADGVDGMMGATGEQGESGQDGDLGPMGSTGWTGAAGTAGEKGERGFAGAAGAAGSATAGASTDDDEGIQVISIILLIWLIIVTILLIIFIILTICVYRRYRRHVREHPHYYANGAYDAADGNGLKREKDSVKFTTRVPSYLEGQPTWTSTMKSIAESTYSNDTLEDSNPSTPQTQARTEHEASHVALSNNPSDTGSSTGLVPTAPARQDSAQSDHSIDSKFAI